jgi:uncharacterized protein (TIGR03437 family)
MCSKRAGNLSQAFSSLEKWPSRIWTKELVRRVLSDSQNLMSMQRSTHPWNDFLACAGLLVSQHRTLEKHKDTLEKPRAFILTLLVLMPFSLLQADQPIQIVALTNSADFQLGLPQKGSLASIFCTGLQGSLGVVTAPPQYPLPTEIVSGGLSISVSINFTPAPILAIAFEQGYQQLNVQVPWEAPEEPLFVQVFQGSNSAYLVDPNPWVDLPSGNPATFKWSIFFVDSQGYAIVQHASNYSQVTEQTPAVPGEFLVAYGINLGPVDNVPVSGYPAPSDPLASNQVPQDACMMSDIVTIGTASVIPAYVGLAPGIVGVYQVNFQVPANVPAGD